MLGIYLQNTCVNNIPKLINCKETKIKLLYMYMYQINFNNFLKKTYFNIETGEPPVPAMIFVNQDLQSSTLPRVKRMRCGSKLLASGNDMEFSACYSYIHYQDSRNFFCKKKLFYSYFHSDTMSGGHSQLGFMIHTKNKMSKIHIRSKLCKGSSHGHSCTVWI